MTLKRVELEKYFNDLLKPQEFEDYGPNGLQIEGNEELSILAFAVSATRESIREAISLGAQALIVHHGLFWKFHGVRTLTGPFGKRVRPLIQNNINLFGFHLPLDGHLEIGNAAVLAKKIGLQGLTPFGDYKGSTTGVKGKFPQKISATDLKDKISSVLNHQVLMASSHPHLHLSTMGIITGGANSGWQEASKESLDSYLTGEMSEHDWHESQESEITMFAGGHNATEQFGIQTLMEKVKGEFGIECHFLPSPNPA